MLFSGFKTAALAIACLASTLNAAPASKKPRGVDALTMPDNTLPPVGIVKLKYVVLGLGTQNYTCADSTDAAIPGSAGAVAKLWDIGTPLSKDPWGAWKLPSITPLALALHDKPRDLDAYLKVMRFDTHLGEHFFNTNKIPTFNLRNVKMAPPTPLAVVKKNGTMDAPEWSCRGTKNEGAVQWLQLIDNGGSVGGVNTVYRIYTAGGSPPKTCAGQDKSFTVPYAAQYWIFG